MGNQLSSEKDKNETSPKATLWFRGKVKALRRESDDDLFRFVVEHLAQITICVETPVLSTKSQTSKPFEETS